MKLYKFRGLDDAYDFTENIICKGEVFCCPPKRLNDPHELATTYTFDADDKAKLDFWMGREQKEVLSGMPNDKIRLSYISNIEREVQKTRLEFFHRDTAIGILSLAESWKNLVLWSHYAKSHTGICIEFETDNDPLLKKAEKIKYSSSVAKIPFYQMDLLTAVKEALSYKFEDWDYEEEWRVWRNPSGIHTLSKGAVTAVYFGMNADITQGNQREFYEMLRSQHPNISTFKVIRDRTTFELKADPLVHPPMPRQPMDPDFAKNLLMTFVERVDELEGESFWQFYLKNGIKTEMKAKDESTLTEESAPDFDYINEFPSTESLKAFILTYRMFVKKNDKLSLENICSALSSLDSKTAGVVDKCRGIFDDLLSRQYTNEVPTIRDLIDSFIYGRFAHTTKIRERAYRKIEVEDEGMRLHLLFFHGTLFDIVQLVLLPLRDESVKVFNSVK